VVVAKSTQEVPGLGLGQHRWDDREIRFPALPRYRELLFVLLRVAETAGTAQHDDRVAFVRDGAFEVGDPKLAAAKMPCIEEGGDALFGQPFVERDSVGAMRPAVANEDPGHRRHSDPWPG
jgi:hypothetical protein